MEKIYFVFSYLLLFALTPSFSQIDSDVEIKQIEIQTEKGHYNNSHSNDRSPGDILAVDDFSDPSNWNVYTESGTVPNWQFATSTPSIMVTYMEAMASPSADNGFALLNAIQYLIPPGTEQPINALLEYGSPINCSAAAQVHVEFFIAYRAFNFDQIFLEVTNSDWAFGPGTVSYELFTELISNDPTVQTKILRDISSVAAGQPNVKIRFRFRELYAFDGSGAGYGAMIDDFRVKEAWNYDQELTTSFHRSGLGLYMPNGLDYHFIPPSQLTEIHFSGITQNVGGMVQTGAKLNVNVSGAESFSTSSTPIDLPLLATDSLICNDIFTPTSEGEYSITHYVDCDFDEEETTNDSAYRNLTVTPYFYGRDNGQEIGWIGNVTTNPNNPLLIGNIMDVFGDDTVEAIDIVMTAHPSNVTKVIYGQIMIYDEVLDSFIFLAKTIEHTITIGDNGGLITIPFEDPVELLAGQTILLLAGHYGGITEARFRTSQRVEFGTVLGYIDGATETFSLGSPSAIMIRARFGTEPIDDTGMEELNAAGLSVGQNYPNPFSNESIIPFETTQQSNFTIEITDLYGKLIKTFVINDLTPGSHQLLLNGEDFAQGVYFYTFYSGFKPVTKQFISIK